jgi:hypothetical protein
MTSLILESGGGIFAMTTDLGKIAGAIATAGGNADTIMIFAAPKEAIKLRLHAGPQFSNSIIGTSALSDGSIIGVAPEAIATGYSGLPEIDISKNAVAHFEDTAVTDIGVAGTLASGSVRSAWQTNLLKLRLRIKCCLGVLAPGTVQLI